MRVHLLNSYYLLLSKCVANNTTVLRGWRRRRQQFALFCAVATAVQFCEVLAKSRHIYSHVLCGIFPSTIV